MKSKCDEWQHGTNKDGYGIRWFNGTCVGAHRVAWMEKVGPIPKGMLVLHKCDNRPCIRISHLYIGTHADNMRDQINRKRHASLKKTHCPQDHKYTKANTYRQGTRRICLSCKREQDKIRSRYYRARKKGAS